MGRLDKRWPTLRSVDYGRKSGNVRGEYVIDYNHTESCPLPCLDYCHLTTYPDKYLRSLLQCRITGFLLCIQESLHALNLPGTVVQTMERIPQAARCMIAHFQIIIVIFSLKLIPTGAYSGLSLSAVRICYTLCACVLVCWFGCVSQCRAYHVCKCATFLHASDWFMYGYIFRSTNIPAGIFPRISTLVQLRQQLA